MYQYSVEGGAPWKSPEELTYPEIDVLLGVLRDAKMKDHLREHRVQRRINELGLDQAEEILGLVKVEGHNG